MKDLGCFVGRSAAWQEGCQEGSAQGSWWGEPGQREGVVGIPGEAVLRTRATSVGWWRQHCGDPCTTSDPCEAVGLRTGPRARTQSRDEKPLGHQHI